MFAGDLVTLAFFSLIPIGVPLIFLGLHFGVAVVQAYVFMLLAMIYLRSRCRTNIKSAFKFRAEVLQLAARLPLDPAGAPSAVRTTADQREGASTVSLNHPLAARSYGGMEQHNA